MIDWGQLIPWLLGIVGMVIGAWSYTSKGKVRIQLHQVQVDLQRVRNEASEFDQMMKLVNRQGENLQRQIKINESFTAALQTVATANEENYLRLRQLQGDHTQEIVDRLEELPGKIKLVSEDALRTITAEMGMMLAEIVRKHSPIYEPVFPSLRDQRWIEAFIHPRNGVACLFDEPKFTELARTLGPEHCLKGEERAWVIQEAAPGFHAIRRANGTYGFLQMAAVIVVEIRVHKEKRDVKNTSGNGHSVGPSDAGDGDAGGSTDASTEPV